LNDTGAQPGAAPSTGEHIRALGLIGGGIVLVLLLLLWLLGAAMACGCTTPPAMNITNQGPAAMVTWEADGFLGTPIFGSSGSDIIPACQVYGPRAQPGARMHFTITTAASSWSTSLVAPKGGDDSGFAWVVIHPDGSVAQEGSGPRSIPVTCGP